MVFILNEIQEIKDKFFVDNIDDSEDESQDSEDAGEEEDSDEEFEDDEDYSSNFDNEYKTILKSGNQLNSKQDVSILIEINAGNGNGGDKKLNKCHFIRFQNKSIKENELPEHTEILCLSDNYNSMLLSNTCPSFLKILEFGKCFNQHIPREFFKIDGTGNLHRIEFGRDYNLPIGINVIPDTVITVMFGDRFNWFLPPNTIPIGVVKLEFGEDYSAPFIIDSIPSTVRFLKLGNRSNLPINWSPIPKVLYHLTFGDDYNHPILPGDLSTHLSFLKFGKSFNQSLSQGSITSKVQTLVFGESFNRSVKQVGILPRELKSLTFGNRYNKNIQLSHCSNLTSIKFGSDFNKPISGNQLPIGIREIEFGINFTQPIPSNLFTTHTSIKSITLTKNYSNTHQLPKTIPTNCEIKYI